MMVWNYIVIGLGLVLLVVLLGKELGRKGRPRLAARMAATVLAVGALVCMEQPISCRRVQAGVNGKEGVLLTEGYNADSVRLFLKGHEGMKVMVADDGMGAENAVRAENGVRVGRWHVFGYGLTGDEWRGLHAPELVFHSLPVKEGLVAMDWRRRLIKGERLELQGHWRGEGRVCLLLTGMGQVLDSAVVNGDSAFALHTVPAQTGRAVYQFVAVKGIDGIRDGGKVKGRDTLEKEEVPVEVGVGKPLKILLLASSPDAENTFLVSWLAKGGHEVVSRTLVSKDKYQEAYANRRGRSLGQVGPAMLEGFDLVVADALTLSREGLLSILRKQVAEKGLGLVVRVDSAGGAAIGVSARGSANGISARGSVNGDGVRIKEKEGMRVLLRDSLGRIEVGSSREGAGKIVYTSGTTYPMVLAGERERYAAYWSSLLQEAAREMEPGQEWGWRPELPRVREPVLFVVQAGGSGTPQGVMDGSMEVERPVTVYLAEDGVLPYSWSGRYWPGAAGWQTVRTLQGDTTWWYVWKERAWTSLYREKRKMETENYIREKMNVGAGVKSGEEQGEQKGRERRVAVSKGWFYALFLVSLLFLWIEKKIL